MNLKGIFLSADETYHMYNEKPLYNKRFYKVGKYHEPGFAPVSDSSGSYHIDLTGNSFYPQRYLKTFGFYDGFAAVSNENGWFHINHLGKQLYPDKFNWVGNFQEDKCVILDFSNNYFHIDNKGNPIYKNRYAYVGDYRDGIACAIENNGDAYHIDNKGNRLYAHSFCEVDVFHKGFARAKDENGWFHIDKRGTPIYETGYKNIEPFYNGQAKVETYEESLQIINETGEVIRNIVIKEKDYFGELSSDMTGYWRSQTIKTAVEIGLIETLPADLNEISRKIAISEEVLHRFLYALQELRIVCYKDDNKYDLANKGKYLKKDITLSLHNAAIVWGEEHYASWMELTEAVKTCESPFISKYKMDFFSWIKEDDIKLQSYFNMIKSYAQRDYREISNYIKPINNEKIMDVGCGSGDLLINILRDNPNTCGVFLDSPEVLKLIDLPPELKNRSTFEPADIFKGFTYPVDMIILARVLHDWNDKYALTILNNCINNLKSNGKLFIIEIILDYHRCSGGLLDLNMLVMTGGKERTLDDWNKLVEKSGGSISDIIRARTVSDIIVCTKKEPK